MLRRPGSVLRVRTAALGSAASRFASAPLLTAAPTLFQVKTLGAHSSDPHHPFRTMAQLVRTVSEALACEAVILTAFPPVHPPTKTCLVF